MPTVVDLRRAADLTDALHKLVRALERQNLIAMERAARWGFNQAIIRTQRGHATASRTFIQAWFTKRIDGGAIVGNSAAHAVFVERGRKPGKMPPVSVIEEWIKVKKIAKMARKPTHKEARKAVIGKGPSGNISGAKQRARLQRDIKHRSKIFKSAPARAYRHDLMVKAMALAIARKIGRKGTKGRFILRDIAPKMAARYWRETRQRMRQVFAAPPR